MTDMLSADQALKAKHRTMWALGDYPAVAGEVIPALGPVLVEACGIGAGDRVLDVAAGSGNAAIPAARTGAAVDALDLTPALLDAGRVAADAAGVRVEWLEGDAEDLPLGDATYDVVMSCVGVMFAPHHDAAAAELLRVCRPGGRIGLISWTPGGFIGRMFATMKPFVPAPPPGAQPPPLWGDEAHVRALLGAGVSSLTAEKRRVEMPFGSAREFLDFFKRCYGPTIVAYRGLAAEPERVAALDAALLELAAEPGIMNAEYLLVTATRA